MLLQHAEALINFELFGLTEGLQQVRDVSAGTFGMPQPVHNHATVPAAGSGNPCSNRHWTSIYILPEVLQARICRNAISMS